MNAVKEIAGILLGKEGQGTLKAHMVRGTVGTFTLKVVNTILAFGTSLLLGSWLRPGGGLQCEYLKGKYGLRAASVWRGARPLMESEGRKF